MQSNPEEASTFEHVEYRNQTPAPTERGLYWAKKAWWSEIDPIWLSDDGTVFIIGDERKHPKDEFVFFGPVIPLKESTYNG